jgi:hypothetical protein
MSNGLCAFSRRRGVRRNSDDWSPFAFDHYVDLPGLIEAEKEERKHFAETLWESKGRFSTQWAG